LFFISKDLSAQDRSNRGKEFWMAYGFDYTFLNESPVNSQELAIYISTIDAATVTVTVTNTGYTQTLNIPANTVDASILIPKSGANDARTLTDGLQSRGIHIVSDVPVAAYAHVYATQVSGATMLMPVETYGNKYYSINYNQSTSNSNLPNISPTSANGNDWYSWFYVIASEDNTRLEITPSDSTKNGWLPGQTYIINLNKGESYHVFGKLVNGSSQAWAASKDMTGSKVLSVAGSDGKCHPVALFSGSGGIRMCRGDGGEFMQQQVFPAQAWGTRYLTYHTINNANTDINETNRNYYRICVQDPSSVVKRNGTVLTGLTNNFFYEIMDSTGGDYITSDKPILVAQYTPNKSQCWRVFGTTPSPPSYGDPEMFFLSPIEQGQKSVLFYTSRKSTIDYVYVNIQLPTNAVGSLLVDGAAVPLANVVTHPNLPSYSVALARFIGPAAQHLITSDSAFTATVYGLGNYESYGYNVGTLINNLNALGGIANTLNTNNKVDTFTCPKSPIRLIIKVAYRATSLNWRLSQAGGGLAPNTDSLINNPVPIDSNLVNGRRYYTYTLQQDFTFTTSGTYLIPVIYTSPDIDNCNHADTAKIQIVVKQGPVTDFTFAPVLCIQDTAHFKGATNAGIFDLKFFKWYFNDNTTATGINADKHFTTLGNHPVRYEIITANGCIDDTTKILTFLGSPTAKFGINHNICVGDSIRFSDSSSVAVGNIASWQWNFGDGNTATYTNNNPFYHPYTTAGNFTLSLVATSDIGCKSDIFKLPVAIGYKPVTKFGILNPNICSGDSVRISDSSVLATGSINSWQWNFGENNNWISRTNNTPFYHIYPSPGTFVVSLVTGQATGCNGDTFKISVTVSAKPVSKFIVDKNNICLRDSIKITDISTIGAGSISSWRWDFGDGNTVTYINGNPFFHRYALPGNYIISLVASPSGAGGCISDTFKLPITVTNAPLAKFGYSRNICVGDSIKFSDSSRISLGSIVGWKWDFGDGNNASYINNNPFYHKYTTAGTFTVTFVATPNAGCTDTFRLNVVVSQKPLPSFTIAGVPCKDSAITMQSNLSGPNLTYYWDFGNGQTVVRPNNSPIVIAYTTASNNINIKHVVSAGIGCVSDTIIKPLVIDDNPIAAFDIVGDTLCQNKPLFFIDKSLSNAITGWTWNFGDGKTSILPSLYKSFTNAGTYQVSLKVTTADGCGSAPLLQPITINKLPIIDAGPSFAVQQGSLVTFKPVVNDSAAFSFLWTPTFDLNNPTYLHASLIAMQNQTYLLTASGIGNCFSYDTLNVKILHALQIPNVFSPNGDGINDTWMVGGLQDYTNASIQIFDRYGRQVFTQTGYNKPWNGNLDGKPLPFGTYYYIIDTKTDIVKPLAGSVTIIR